jgi:Arc/MetJ-type ribon-helix-helix transcriptional regulator
MTSITVKLSSRLSARVAYLARQRRVSRSEVVRQALEAFPGDEAGTVVERLSHLLGAVERLPRDLSTSPRHLRGFGK